MAMPPPVLDRHDLRGARTDGSDGGRFLMHSAYQGQQPLAPLPIRLPNHLLYLQQQHQQQQQQQQQHMHHQRLISDEEAFRMRQRPLPLPPPLAQSSSRVLVSDKGVESIGAAAAAAAYRQRLSGTLRGHQSAAFLEPESRWVDREPRVAYTLSGSDLQRLEPPVLPYESNLLPEDVVRLRQALKQSRSFAYHQPQAVNNDHEKARIADEVFRGGSLADPFSRNRFSVWESGLLDRDHSKTDSRVHAVYPVAEKQPSLFLDQFLGRRVPDLGYPQPAALYQSRNQENLASSLPAFRNPAEPVLNKRHREESVHLEREEVQRARRLSGSESGAYAGDLTISGARQGRADSVERNYHGFGASFGVGTTGTYKQGNTNPNQASLTTNFVVDYPKVAGRDSGISLTSNDFAAGKDERSINRKPAKKRVTTSLSDRSLSPRFRYRSPGGRDRLYDEIRSTSERIQRRLSDHGEVKRRLEPSRARASLKQTQPSVSIHSRLQAENDSNATKHSKKIFPRGSIKASPKSRGREHDQTLVSQEVEGGRHQPAALSKKRLHDKIASVPTTSGKEKPLKFRKYEQFANSSKIKANSVNNVVHLASPHDFAASGEKNGIKGVESQKIVNKQQQGDDKEDTSVQFVSEYQEKVNETHHCNVQIDKNVHNVSETKESAQGLTQQSQETSSGFQLLGGSQRLSENSEKLQFSLSVQPSDVSRIDSACWKVLEGLQTLDPFQVCVQGPSAVCDNLCIDSNDSDPCQHQNHEIYPCEDNTGRPVEHVSPDSKFHGNSRLGIYCKQQEYPCSVSIIRSIPDQSSLEMGKPVSSDLQDDEVDNGQQNVEALKGMDADVERLITIKKCESGDFVHREFSSIINRIASSDCTVSVGEARSLEAYDSTPPGKVVLHYSKTSTTIVDSLGSSQEQVPSSPQCDADPAQQPRKHEEAITVKPGHQQHETSKAGYSLQTKHNTAISASKLPKLSPCQVFTKKKDTLPLAFEKQKSSTVLLSLSKPSNEDTAVTKFNGHEQKDDIRIREREDQVLQPKHPVLSLTPKLSSRAYFQKNLQKGSVWSRSPATRTWHRDNSPSLTGSRESSVNRKPHLTTGQSGEVTNMAISTKPASYVRKGNSLVRTSGLTANTTAISSKPFTQPERRSIESVAKTFSFENSSPRNSLDVYSHFLGGALEQKSGMDAGSLSAISNQAASSQGIVANFLAVPSEFPSMAPVEVIPELLTEQNVSIETTNHRNKLGAEDIVVADKLETALGNNVMDDGLHLTFESRQGGNNLIAPSMTRSYVRSKANQLVVAPVSLSEYLEDQTNKDGHEKQLQDLYVRKKSNQLVRNSFVSKTENGDLLNNGAPRSVSNQSHWERKGKPRVPAMLSTKLGRVLSQKKVLGLRVPLVWTLNGTNKKCQSTTIKGSASSLVPWKKPGLGVGLRSRLLKALPKGRKGSLLSLISRKLQNMRMSQPIYTRSASGFSLHRSGVMSLGGANLKWTKSMEKNSKKAREEATKVVAAVAKERREKKEAVAAAAKARSDRIAARKATRNLKSNSRKWGRLNDVFLWN
ncbi:hypothetical protein O6H91_22G031200 [Diphasiastrum complanatum]|uniref:Uncharacterized protein n=1 Tax=Diphasiastrum complanatum TaxID=34168 RepID=A0ACC2AE48_DIPCM|nr:hypothetical protein O6H91_22G031200 [Diphasiastrum complanatum]